jgi:enoyl-[acyl-carrier protein] reductase II
MHPETLLEHILKTKKATDKPFGVNVPLLYPQIEEIMTVIAAEKVPIVFTSAGSPKKWTGWLKERGILVAHVVSSAAFAVKCEEAGVDAVVAEGFEAGGHNGREETTTMSLIPAVRKATTLPLLAAGGIGSGRAMLAAMALGADGVQIGSRFALTQESSAHENFKQLVAGLGEGATKLVLKKLAPVRLVKNEFFNQVNEAELRGADSEELKILLSKGRAKRGIFEGDLKEGELEIGQVSAQMEDIPTVAELMKHIVAEYEQVRRELVEGANFSF